jgi:hypothetical protein
MENESILHKEMEQAQLRAISDPILAMSFLLMRFGIVFMANWTFNPSLKSHKVLRMEYTPIQHGSTGMGRGNQHPHHKRILPPVLGKDHLVVLALMEEGLILKKMLQEGIKLYDTLIKD